MKLPFNLQFFADGAGGEGTSTDPTGTQGVSTTQQPQIDYEKMAEAISKRTSQTADNVLKGYLKQQGLTGEELDQAINTFKQQKSQAESQKLKEQENMKLENQKLRAQILNSSIDNKLASLATAEGVLADKVPFLAKLIEREGLSDEKGNVLEDKVKEAMMNVIKAFPEFKGNPQQQSSGFQQIGSSSTSNPEDADKALRKAFGLK